MPFWGQLGNGRYSHVRSALARAAGRGQLVPSITHTARPSTNAESASVLANRLRTFPTSTEPSASASHVLGHRRRNTAVKLSRTSVLRWGCGQRRIHQLEQAILTYAQALVELLPEADERHQFFGFHHTPSLTRFSRNRKSLRPPGLVCIANSRLGSRLGAWTKNCER
jgi:hypothetical protein